MKKINKNSINNYLRRHGLREPDKIDILFGTLSIIMLIICTVSSIVGGLQKQNNYLLSVNKNLELKNEDLIETINTYEEEYGPLYEMEASLVYYDSTFSLLNKNFYEMTKTEMKNHLNELDSFISHFKNYGINENDKTYNLVVEEYNNCKTALEKGYYKNPYTEEDLILLAYTIMQEQGDNRNSDECQSLVACVVLNRRANGGINGELHFPSIKDIINEKGQYHFAVVNNYNISLKTIDTSIITERCYENARRVLEGEFTCPSNVMYQATFKQGSGVYKSFYNEGYGTTTYFCYL